MLQQGYWASKVAKLAGGEIIHFSGATLANNNSLPNYRGCCHV